MCGNTSSRMAQSSLETHRPAPRVRRRRGQTKPNTRLRHSKGVIARLLSLTEGNNLRRRREAYSQKYTRNERLRREQAQESSDIVGRAYSQTESDKQRANEFRRRTKAPRTPRNQ